jgi:hypothetical protein
MVAPRATGMKVRGLEHRADRQGRMVELGVRSAEHERPSARRRRQAEEHPASVGARRSRNSIWALVLRSHPLPTGPGRRGRTGRDGEGHSCARPLARVGRRLLVQRPGVDDRYTSSSTPSMKWFVHRGKLISSPAHGISIVSPSRGPPCRRAVTMYELRRTDSASSRLFNQRTPGEHCACRCVGRC